MCLSDLNGWEICGVALQCLWNILALIMTRIVWNVRSFSTPMKSEVRGRFLEPNFPLISFIIAKTDVCLDENEVCFNERELRKIDSSMTNTSKFCIYFIFNFVFYLAPYSSTSMMNMFWSFFVTSLSKPGIPDYVLRVYNSKFFLLPWQSFLPTLHNLQLMQQVRFKVAFVTISSVSRSFIRHFLCRCGQLFFLFPLVVWRVQEKFCLSWYRVSSYGLE